MPFVCVFGDFLKITLAVARIGWNHLSHRHSTVKIITMVLNKCYSTIVLGNFLDLPLQFRQLMGVLVVPCIPYLLVISHE